MERSNNHLRKQFIVIKAGDKVNTKEVGKGGLAQRIQWKLRHEKLRYERWTVELQPTNNLPGQNWGAGVQEWGHIRI